MLVAKIIRSMVNVIEEQRRKDVICIEGIGINFYIYLYVSCHALQDLILLNYLFHYLI